MAQIHTASQQVRRKRGLENRLHPATLVVQVILVAIQQVGLRILDGLGHTIERVRRQHIVLIQETCVFPAGQFACPVQSTRNAQALARAYKADAGFGRHQGGKIAGHPILCGRIVAHAELPAAVGLVEHRGNRSFQPVPPGIVHR